MDLREVPQVLHRRHPWEVARARFFRRVLGRAGALTRPTTVLDVGAGDGYLAATLAAGMPDGSRIVCLDANYGDGHLSPPSDSTRVSLTFSRELSRERFDIILLLDVIEHVEDDRGFVSRLVSENLKTEGLVLVSVPAWQPLFTQHDRKLNHFRRYSPEACRRVLRGANLTLLQGGGLFHGPLVGRALVALRESLERRLGRSVEPIADLGQWTRGHLLSDLVERVLVADTRLSEVFSRVGLPAPGLTFWALCQSMRHA